MKKRKSSVGMVAFAFALITLATTLVAGLAYMGKINAHNKMQAQYYYEQLKNQDSSNNSLKSEHNS